ncbi:hypothetical protein [Paracoccus pacificus]|uniref:Uncharacterized protein n=1 Tax=Paracoccus pacificus TaxID=1463598 RepID=A0ABW4R852_9RHOB
MMASRAQPGRAQGGRRVPLYKFSNDSAELLIEGGFRYEASLMGHDIPCLINAEGGSLIGVPSR